MRFLVSVLLLLSMVREHVPVCVSVCVYAFLPEVITLLMHPRYVYWLCICVSHTGLKLCTRNNEIRRTPTTPNLAHTLSQTSSLPLSCALSLACSLALACPPLSVPHCSSSLSLSLTHTNAQAKYTMHAATHTSWFETVPPKI